MACDICLSAMIFAPTASMNAQEHARPDLRQVLPAKRGGNFRLSRLLTVRD